MVKKLISQLIPFIAISILFGAAFYAFNFSFFIGVLFGIAFQYVGFFAFSTILNAVVALKNKKLENERLQELSFQGLEVECPCFKKIKDFIPVRLNTPNYYKCSDCKKTISVLINSETAVVTEPVTTDLPTLVNPNGNT